MSLSESFGLRIGGLRRAGEATPDAFERLWRAFLTGRVALALALLGLLLLERLVDGSTAPQQVLVLLLLYLAQTLLVRFGLGGWQPGRGPALHWLLTVCTDLLAISLLLLWHGEGGYSFVPLLGLPLLMAAALGSRTVFLLTVGGVLAALAGEALWLRSDVLALQSLRQALLAAMGFLALGLLVRQMAVKLSGAEEEGRRSREAALLQSHVNTLVISNMDDGVLVVGERLQAHSANPAARAMLGLQAEGGLPLDLTAHSDWQPLAQLARRAMRRRQPQTGEFFLGTEAGPPIGVQARCWITGDAGAGGHSDYCVVFLHDLRRLEAQMRTEKLASMGRMSAAVAHEIRNPLSAIIQANSLLAEDLQQPGGERLAAIVHQNAERLRRISEDILDVARVQKQAGDDGQAERIDLDAWVSECVRDWQAGAPQARVLQLRPGTGGAMVVFDREHLRRILVNLLDNALRYKGMHADSLGVQTRLAASGRALLTVWSDGAALEQTVQAHLFEPFFSSESRSSGLGLFLCRGLCERHGATIGYQRVQAMTTRGPQLGNAFTVQFKRLVSSGPVRAAAALPGELPG